VGPVDDSVAADRAAVIVRADRPPVRTDIEVIGAPRDEAPREHRDPDDVEFELQVNPDDIGHVIGKQGNTVKSLRRVLGAAASRVDRRMGLEIAD
jgi:predicted RNA-binding protein YlqC (UPF0109 family)